MIVQDIFKCDVKFNYKGFDWLKSKKNKKLEIDIFVPSVKLAIEYDGEQHFMPVNFGGVDNDKAKLNLKIIQSRDKLKNKKIKQHKEEIKYFIRFNYKENIIKEYVYNKLVKIGVKI